MSDAGAQTQDLQVKDAVCQSFYANEVGVSNEKKIDKIIYTCCELIFLSNYYSNGLCK